MFCSVTTYREKLYLCIRKKKRGVFPVTLIYLLNDIKNSSGALNGCNRQRGGEGSNGAQDDS